jgi:hypothetical protein
MMCEVSYIGIDVLEEPAASILNPEDGNSTILRNTGHHLSDYRRPHPRNVSNVLFPEIWSSEHLQAINNNY